MPRCTKGQHFLPSAAARTLSLATVLGLSDTGSRDGVRGDPLTGDEQASRVPGLRL